MENINIDFISFHSDIIQDKIKSNIECRMWGNIWDNLELDLLGNIANDIWDNIKL